MCCWVSVIISCSPVLITGVNFSFSLFHIFISIVMSAILQSTHLFVLPSVYLTVNYYFGRISNKTVSIVPPNWVLTLQL